MSITQEQIKNIANLSKLRLENEEQLTQNINDILGYVEQLGEVDTTGVVGTVSVVPGKNRLREDKVQKGNPKDLLECSGQRVIQNQIAIQNIM
ncbi:MAG: Asp-tRNA(Asn)/Glu-tRNA(Gln) amidotransferase subunit GatC [Candidatus Gracilibacteria bacterium]|nr:Asp-tRNA(Asn)/Glu-tRNA(Gln) amidotransferase subunit GatC [Candidatus Gracilibacteria bacterium]